MSCSLFYVFNIFNCNNSQPLIREWMLGGGFQSDWVWVCLGINLTHTSVCEKNLTPSPIWTIYHLEYRLSRNLSQTHSQSRLQYKICDMFRTTYRMCLKIKYEGYSKFEKNHLNREINKYKADKACFLGQWRMPKINNTITWGIERPWTVE